jgi:hypothetical protein
MAKKNVVRGVGRPPVYVGRQKDSIVSAIRKLGLTGARAALAERDINISLPTLGKFAKEAKIKLQAGRPPADGKAKAKPAKAAKKPAKAKAKAAKPAAAAKVVKAKKPRTKKPAAVVAAPVADVVTAPVAETVAPSNADLVEAVAPAAAESDAA